MSVGLTELTKERRKAGATFADVDARPASTLVEVSALVVPGAKVEIEAVAVLP